MERSTLHTLRSYAGVLLLLFSAPTFAGCSPGFMFFPVSVSATPADRGAGGLIGGALGAVIGAAAFGNPLAGAGLGAVAGVLAGDGSAERRQIEGRRLALEDRYKRQKEAHEMALDRHQWEKERHEMEMQYFPRNPRPRP